MRSMSKRGVVSLSFLLLVGWASGARADGRTIVGADMGAVVPKHVFRQLAETGGVLSPYAAYMVNEWVGAMLQLQVLGAPGKSSPEICPCNTWAFAYAAGPRLAIPLADGVEIYGTWQGGGISGLKSGGAITKTSWGFSTGGGVDFALTDNIYAGVFARWNRWYQQPFDAGDVRYVSAGISLSWRSAPPPPPPVVVAEVVEVIEEVPPAPPPKRKIVLRGVHFDFDKENIRPDARPILDEAIRILAEEGTVSIVAEGHTDSVGSAQYNIGLSLRRANAVRDYLVRGGISPDRIAVEGFGLTRPVASNDTPEGRAQNRRVELRVVD